MLFGTTACGDPCPTEGSGRWSTAPRRFPASRSSFGCGWGSLMPSFGPNSRVPMMARQSWSHNVLGHHRHVLPRSQQQFDSSECFGSKILNVQKTWNPAPRDAAKCKNHAILIAASDSESIVPHFTFQQHWGGLECKKSTSLRWRLWCRCCLFARFPLKNGCQVWCRSCMHGARNNFALLVLKYVF